MMMNLDDIRNNQDLIDAIDWDLTPEDAVRLYLEWGNNWAHRSNYVIRSKDDVSHYFVVNTWEDTPVVYLIRRNSEEAVEMARIRLPEKIKAQFLSTIGNMKGVYAIEGPVRKWLQSQLMTVH